MADIDDRPQAPIEGDYMPPAGGGAPQPPTTQSFEGAGGLTRAEIDIQISTARAHPRMITDVMRTIESFATIDTPTALSCIYRLPRKKDGKTVYIEGPSIRFAEIVTYAMGNVRVASRMTDMSKTAVEATGIYHDLERNVAVARAVRRRITTSGGSRFNEDMINVTINAAAAIAQRNAILAGAPRAFWGPAYEKAKAVALGTAATLVDRRASLIRAFADMDVPKEAVFELLEVKSLEDITLEVLLTAGGIFTALRDGEDTLENMLAEVRAAKAPAAAADKSLAAANGPKPEPAKTTAVGKDAAPKDEPGKLKRKAVADPPHDPETGEIKDEVGDAVIVGSAAPAKVEAPKEDGAGESSSPATSSDSPAADNAAETSVFDVFLMEVGDIQTLEALTDSYDELLASDEWESGSPEAHAAVHAAAYQHAMALAPDANPEFDPWLFMLWIKATTPFPPDVARAHQSVMRTSLYRQWPEEKKNALSRLVAKARGL